MKIMLISSLYYPYVKGGAEFSIRIIAEKLVEKGHQVIILTSYYKDEVTFLNKVKIYNIKIPNIYWRYYSNQKNYLLKVIWNLIDTYNIFIKSKITKILEIEKPDVAHTNILSSFSCYIWKLLKKKHIPIIHTSRDYYLICPKYLMFKKNQICKKQCFDCKILSIPKKNASSYVDGFVGISQYIVNKHINMGYFKNASIVKYIYNPVVLNKTINNNVMQNDRLIIGFVGQLFQGKGIEFLLEKFYNYKNNDNFQLNIYGKFKNKSYANKIKNKYFKKNIHFCGFKKQKDIYSNINLVIIPSLWEEPFCRIIIEAYSYGIPVLASNRGAIPEIVIDGKTGFIFNPDLQNDFENKLNILLKKSYFLKEMGKNCYDYSKKFDIEILINKWIDIYKKIKDLR